MFSRFFLFFCSLLFPAAQLISSWTRDYEEALKTSQETHRSLLVAFVGTEWCPWSTKLQEEILMANDFLAPLKEEFILVYAPFPKQFGETENASPKELQLKEKFDVKELPTLALIDESEELIGRIGFLALKPKEYAARLQEVRREYLAIRSVIESNSLKTLSAETLQQLYQRAIAAGCDELQERLLQIGLRWDKGTFFLLERYRLFAERGEMKESTAKALRQKILKRDPSNRQGSQLQLAIFDFKSKANDPKKSKDHKKVIKPLLAYIQEYGRKDKENCWRLEMMIAQFFFSKNRVPEAIEHAKASYRFAPDLMKGEIAQSIQYLEKLK